MNIAEKLLAVSMAAILLLSAAGCRKERPAEEEPAAPATRQEETRTIPETEPDDPEIPDMVFAPEFSLLNEAGNRVSLSDFEGSIVVLEWFNEDCPFVVRHYREGNMTMLDLANKYAARNVVWLAVNSTHYATREDNAQWRSMHNLPYPILDDSSGAIGKLYNATRTPEMYVIDKERRIIYWGAIDNDPAGDLSILDRVNYVDQALSEYLAGRSITTPRTRPYGCTVKYPPQTAATGAEN